MRPGTKSSKWKAAQPLKEESASCGGGRVKFTGSIRAVTDRRRSSPRPEVPPRLERPRPRSQARQSRRTAFPEDWCLKTIQLRVVARLPKHRDDVTHGRGVAGRPRCAVAAVLVGEGLQRFQVAPESRRADFSNDVVIVKWLATASDKAEQRYPGNDHGKQGSRRHRSSSSLRPPSSGGGEAQASD
jgi:hypothetical protein